MKEKKRQIVRCAFYDQTTMQKHFEKMASEGWLIEKISAYFWTYRRIKPQNIHISVTYFPNASEFDPSPSDNQKLMEEFAAKDGWKLLTRWGQIQVFCSKEANPTPIETDPVTQVANIYRAMKKIQTCGRKWDLHTCEDQPLYYLYTASFLLVCVPLYHPAASCTAGFFACVDSCDYRNHFDKPDDNALVKERRRIQRHQLHSNHTDSCLSDLCILKCYDCLYHP